MKATASADDFAKLDIRAGVILSAERNPNAKKPAYILSLDFGAEIGIKRSSGQFTSCYGTEEMKGRTVAAVVNLPPLRVADCVSEVLVLGVCNEQGVVLLQPERHVERGDRIG